MREEGEKTRGGELKDKGRFKFTRTRSNLPPTPPLQKMNQWSLHKPKRKRGNGKERRSSVMEV